MAEFGPVEPDHAARGRPDADQSAGQGRLAGAARADDADALAGRELKGDISDDGGVAAARGDDEPGHVQRLPRRRQGHRLALFGEPVEHAFEATARLPCTDETAPLGDGLLNRRQLPRGQDR